MSLVEHVSSGIPIEIGEMDVSPSKGKIEVIDGCMSSGKSKELIRRLRVLKYSVEAQIASGILPKNTCFDDYAVIFKPEIDNRRGDDSVNSRDGDKMRAVSIKSITDSLKYVSEHSHLTTIAIDEAQFFDANDLITIVRLYADALGKRVIVAGLAKDFKGDKWGGVSELGVIADDHMHLTAACAICGETATMTQRLKKEEGTDKWIPSSRNDPVEIIGEQNYQARCRKHHQIS